MRKLQVASSRVQSLQISISDHLSKSLRDYLITFELNRFTFCSETIKNLNDCAFSVSRLAARWNFFQLYRNFTQCHTFDIQRFSKSMLKLKTHYKYHRIFRSWRYLNVELSVLRPFEFPWRDIYHNIRFSPLKMQRIHAKDKPMSLAEVKCRFDHDRDADLRKLRQPDYFVLRMPINLSVIFGVWSDD